jgi:hypothetical protein
MGFLYHSCISRNKVWGYVHVRHEAKSLRIRAEYGRLVLLLPRIVDSTAACIQNLF